MTSIPMYNSSTDAIRYKYLEKLDKYPDYKAGDIDMKKFKLRRNRLTYKATTGDKIKALAGSLLGTAIPLLLMMKKQRLKNPFKLEYGLKEMLILSGFPILGGVTFGMIGNDKKTNAAKGREGLFQFLNASIPTWMCGGALALCEHSTKLNNVPAKILSIIASVLIGMHGAASLSNAICDPKDKYPDRKLSLRDSIANVDDLVGVFVLAKFPLASKLHIEKLLPFIYSYCGFRAGKSN